MPLRKQYILVSSDNRTNTSDATTNFTVHLSNPIINVVKLDLVEFILDYGIVGPDLNPFPSQPSYFLIQSRNLGTDIVTANGNAGYWRLVPNAVSNNILAFTNSRTDDYLQSPKTIQDIDVQLLLPNGTLANNSAKPLRMLIEVVSVE